MLEKDIYISEGQYLKESVNIGGNIFKGWDPSAQISRGMQPNTATARGQKTKINQPDRFFSNSSTTAPVGDDELKLLGNSQLQSNYSIQEAMEYSKRKDKKSTGKAKNGAKINKDHSS
mmetsp:Transcript_20677/g.14842  ORF Transcript_20677/g.14842 Transcript_20677/m.14842 type:complete len:118 (-) Transcript_20677:469-822(-)|eukprot:CAMPEP_0116886710 /NCGR_PEP_ID=MMETSP0463-20121206/20657_1 /TAXON_ID=181622 /ORGANISM="Strombidinopsis sp, Strain SopsisLIS2011" /LENGTH=117 /DNA_ID=CAMNT_0004547597 /DNA_START=70 /DNA_END=423 /DNA_ORIENTATION=+